MDWIELAETFGTPTYAYDRNALLENVRFFKRAIGPESLLAVAVKANANPQLLRILAKEGTGADIVSGGEMRLTLGAGIPAERTIFSGIGKTDAEIRAAIENGLLCLNVESQGECDRIRRIATDRGKTVGISFRVNPNIAIDSHPKISTGLWEHKFGMSEDDVMTACRGLRGVPEVRVLGFHAHLGSQILEREPLQALSEQTPRLAGALTQALDYPLTFVNWGGGYGVTSDGSRPAWLESWLGEAASLSASLGLRAVFEPGRSIFANTGTLVTRVIEIKRNARKTFVVVDAGMNDLVRPAMYGAIHPITKAGPASGKTMRADIVGPVCESSDTFATDLSIDANLTYGDLLLIHQAGAYGYAMASTYNQRPKPAEILLEEGIPPRLIRPRGFESLPS